MENTVVCLDSGYLTLSFIKRHSLIPLACRLNHAALHRLVDYERLDVTPDHF